MSITATLAALTIMGWSGAKGGNPAELPVAATAPFQAFFEEFHPKSLEAACPSYQKSNNVWPEERQHSSATKGLLPQAQSRNRQAIGRVYKSNITPHWFADSTHFWYRNDLPNGTHEYILVDAI
ncbi:MAG: hypothetical protein JW829_13980, partial [Pirellulales bacterium]|nr:hypothetical protein [Pirellulales bacterium]